jgi:hypothetical protein
VADVGSAFIGRTFGHLAGSFHALQREPQLGVAGRLGEFFDRVPIPVPAPEVHTPVNPGGITLEHLLDEAHALEELRPIEGRDEAQAAHQAGHERLLGGFMAAFRPDRLVEALTPRDQRGIQLLAQDARGESLLARMPQ